MLDDLFGISGAMFSNLDIIVWMTFQHNYKISQDYHNQKLFLVLTKILFVSKRLFDYFMLIILDWSLIVWTEIYRSFNYSYPYHVASIDPQGCYKCYNKQPQIALLSFSHVKRVQLTFGMCLRRYFNIGNSGFSSRETHLGSNSHMQLLRTVFSRVNKFYRRVTFL